MAAPPPGPLSVSWGGEMGKGCEARIGQWQDIRVLEVCGGSDPGEEPFRPDYRRELGAQDLDRALAVALEALGEIDLGHAARA